MTAWPTRTPRRSRYSSKKSPLFRVWPWGAVRALIPRRFRIFVALFAAVITVIVGLLREKETPPAVETHAPVQGTASPIEAQGRVVRVVDGDTIVILDEQRKQTKIRMLGIDAPEKSQPLGEMCRKLLASKIAGQSVKVLPIENDRYGRTIAKIIFEGQDINLMQIQEGCAWHYRQFERNQTPEDRQLYSQREGESRAARKGLWKDPRPQAPWDYRKNSRKIKIRGE